MAGACIQLTDLARTSEASMSSFYDSTGSLGAKRAGLGPPAHAPPHQAERRRREQAPRRLVASARELARQHDFARWSLLSSRDCEFGTADALTGVALLLVFPVVGVRVNDQCAIQQ